MHRGRRCFAVRQAGLRHQRGVASEQAVDRRHRGQPRLGLAELQGRTAAKLRKLQVLAAHQPHPKHAPQLDHHRDQLGPRIRISRTRVMQGSGPSRLRPQERQVHRRHLRPQPIPKRASDRGRRRPRLAPPCSPPPLRLILSRVNKLRLAIAQHLNQQPQPRITQQPRPRRRDRVAHQPTELSRCRPRQRLHQQRQTASHVTDRLRHRPHHPAPGCRQRPLGISPCALTRRPVGRLRSVPLPRHRSLGRQVDTESS